MTARAFGYLEQSVKSAIGMLDALLETYKTPPPEPLTALRRALASDLKSAQAIYEEPEQ